MAQLMSETLEKQSNELRQRFFSSPLPQSAGQWRGPSTTHMLDCLPVGVAFLDEHLVLNYQNRVYAEYVETYSVGGSKRAEGRCFFDYLPGSRDWTEKSFRYVKDARSTLIEHDHEIRLIDGAGEKQSFWNANLAAMINPDKTLAGVVIVCQDISFEKAMLGLLIKLEKQIQELAQQLEDSKKAIRFLTDMRFEDKRQMQENLLNNITSVVFPLLEQVKQNDLKASQKNTLDVVFSTLSNLATDFCDPLGLPANPPALVLTPKETQIFTMIKAGKSTKEIAEILCVSGSAISFHRSNIRKKMGQCKKASHLAPAMRHHPLMANAPARRLSPNE